MTKKLSLADFLGSLSIDKATAGTFEAFIAQGFDTLDKILAMTPADMYNAKTTSGTTIGSRAQDIWNSLHSDRLTFPLANAALYLSAAPTAAVAADTNGWKVNLEAFGPVQSLADIKVVVTGAGPLPRDVLANMLKARGATIQSAVSGSTSYLILEDPDSTTSKAKNARKLGIPMLAYDQVFQPLG